MEYPSSKSKKNSRVTVANSLILQDDFPIKILSEKGSQERYKRKGHINAIKTYWARRPLTTLRGIIYSSLVKKNHQSTKKNYSTFCQIIDRIDPDRIAINVAKKEICKSHMKKPIKLLDPFGGGGSTPFEAARLGLKSTVVELNPIAHILEKAILEYPQKYPLIANHLESWGKKVIDRCKIELAKYYPKMDDNNEPIVYFWTRRVNCNICNNLTPVVKNNFLIKKKDKILKVDYKFNNGKSKWILQEHVEPNEKLLRGKIICKICNGELMIKNLEFDITEYELQAICVKNKDQPGKSYYSASEIISSHSVFKINQKINKLLGELETLIPRRKIQKWSGVTNPSVHGFEYIDQLFTRRQLLVILSLIKNARICYAEMIDKDLSEAEAKAIFVYFSALVEHLVDWNNSLTMWIPQNEQSGRSLAGPGLPMRWEFIEINPFSSGPSNLYSKLKRIITSIRAIPKFDHPISVLQGDATRLPFENGSFDTIVTDPPYFDSLYYSVLSDLFIPWFDMLFQNIIPEFSNLDSKLNSEITSSHHLSGSRELARQNYQKMLTSAFKEMNRVLTHSGSITLIYSHKTIEGWATLAHALVDANLTIKSTIPLHMERNARPRNMKSDALNIAIVIILTKAPQNRLEIKKNNIYSFIQTDLQLFLMRMNKLGYLGSDLTVSIAAKLVQYYSNFDVKFNTLSQSFDHFYNQIIKFVEQILVDIICHSSLILTAKHDKLTRLFLKSRLKFGTKSISKIEFQKICKDNNLDEKECQKILSMRFPFELKENRVILKTLGDHQPNNIEMKTEYVNSLIYRANEVFNNKLIEKTEDYSNDTDPFVNQLYTVLAGIELTNRKNTKIYSDVRLIRNVLKRLMSHN